MSITIRRAVEKDYPVIIEALKEFAVFQKTPPEKVTNTPELMQQEQQYFICFIAEDEAGNFAGMATCSFAYYSWSGKSIYLDDLYVKPAYRKQKLGKQLLAKVFELAKAENCKKVKWLVSDWNKNAIDFYIKCGATISEEERVCDMSMAAIDAYLGSDK